LPQKKKVEVTKCNDHCKTSLIARTVKIVVRVLVTRIERKIEDVFGEDCVDLEEEMELGMQVGC
jgi:hypothetical protein